MQSNINNLTWPSIRQPLLWRVRERALRFIGAPEFLSIQIDITNACNLSCSHCYHLDHLDNGALTFDDWVEILAQYRRLCEKLSRRPDILLCGGEPTLSSLFRPILEHIAVHFPEARVALLTNGTLLRRTTVEYLTQFPIEVQVSLDGPNSESHDSVRGYAAFTRAVRGIMILIEHQIPVYILTILSKRTSQDIPAFFDLARELGVQSMNFTRLISSGQGKELVSTGKDDVLTGEDLKRAMESILSHSLRSGVATSTNQPLYVLIDPSLGRNGQYGFQSIVVDYQGNLKVSSRTATVLGNVISEGLENLFFENLNMKRFRQRKVNGCGECRWYGRCGGDRNASFAAYGSYFEKDPGCWLT